MSTEILPTPVRIVTGPCQMTPSILPYVISLASMRVTNPDGKQVPAIWAARNCDEKSRSRRDKDLKGHGASASDIEQYRMELINNISEGIVSPPKPPVTQGAQWAEQIAETGLVVALETMDFVHALMFQGFIPEGKGLLWTPSVMNLGPIAQAIAQVAGFNNWSVGAKNPKWLPIDVDQIENHEAPTTLETTWAGLVTYMMGATMIPPEFWLIARGHDIAGKGLNRNILSHQAARHAKILAQEYITEKELSGTIHIGQVKIVMAIDSSHALGQKRKEDIVPVTVEAMKLKDFEGNPLYDAVVVETTDSSNNLPPSDSAQHITGVELQDMVGEIAKFRPIKGHS